MTEQNIHPCAVQNAFDRATDFLCRSQLQTGAFLTHMAADESMATMRVPESSTFAATFVLYALACLPDGKVHRHAGSVVAEHERSALSGEEGRVLGERVASDPGEGRSPTGDPIRQMQQRAEAFLIREMAHPGIWRYWTSESGLEIDPDLDVTCCASFVLKDALPLIRARGNRQVILGNRNSAGLFLTWIGAGRQHNDVDSVVNANVLLYLGDTPDTRRACEYLNALIADHAEQGASHYYLDDLALYYFISRAFRNGVARLGASLRSIVSRVMDRQLSDGSFGNELLTALAVCTLINCASPEREVLRCAAQSLVRTQQSSGSWAMGAFYSGPEPPSPHLFWFGSEELTTALCLEALALYHRGAKDGSSEFHPGP